ALREPGGRTSLRPRQAGPCRDRRTPALPRPRRSSGEDAPLLFVIVRRDESRSRPRADSSLRATDPELRDDRPPARVTSARQLTRSSFPARALDRGREAAPRLRGLFAVSGNRVRATRGALCRSPLRALRR